VIMIKEEIKKGSVAGTSEEWEKREKEEVCGKRSDPNSRRHQKGQRKCVFHVCVKVKTP